MNKEKLFPSEKTKLFRCECGHYGFLEVTKWEDEDDWHFAFIEEPKDFWQRLTSFFKSKRYISEVIIGKKKIRELKKLL